MKQSIILSLLIIVTLIGTTYGQEHKPLQTKTQISGNDHHYSLDTKLAEPGKEQYEVVSMCAPAKVTPNPDPKEINSLPGEPAPWKVEPKADNKAGIKMQVLQEEPQASLQANDENKQEVPEKSGEVIDYRKLKDSKTQPIPEKNGEVTNYQDMKGPNTQPIPKVKPE